MTVMIRQVGAGWIVEVAGRKIGEASSEAAASALAEKWKAQAWVASWRFCPSPL
jgi:hypothetical protein